jgi:hypothetical protein
MNQTVMEQRISTATAESQRESASDTPLLPSLPKMAYKFAVAGAGVSALAVSAYSAATPTAPEASTPAAKAFLTSEEYMSLQSRLMSVYSNNVVALAALNSRIDELATVVALLVRNQAEPFDELTDSSESLTVDSAILLNRACDLGVFDPAVQVLAERELANDDKFVRLAAIRALSLMEPQRGKKLIAEQLSKEGSAAIRRALEGTLRAIS